MLGQNLKLDINIQNCTLFIIQNHEYHRKNSVQTMQGTAACFFVLNCLIEM